MKTAIPDQTSWFPGSAALRLGEDEVHVWRVRLPGQPSGARKYEDLLDHEERDRASRFHFDRDRHRFIIRRGILRILAGRYQSTDPAQLQLKADDFGKPRLVRSDLRFNLSQSREVVLLAFARDREIGVDVEWMNPELDTGRLAQSAFSEWERQEYDTVAAEQQRLAFFHCWTRKEAFVKATGKGLAYPLDAFDVTVRPDQPPRLLRASESTEGREHWSMRSLTPCPGYAGALVAEGRDWKLSCFRMPNDADTVL